MYHVHCWGPSSHKCAACFSLPALYPLTQASIATFSRTSRARAVFFLVALMLLLSCCFSHGLAPANPFSVVMADPHSCCWHENWPFYVLFISLVVAFGLCYGILQYVCTELNNRYLPSSKHVLISANSSMSENSSKWEEADQRRQLQITIQG